jgi:uncharacterized protein (DUF2147 family)
MARTVSRRSDRSLFVTGTFGSGVHSLSLKPIETGTDMKTLLKIATAAVAIGFAVAPVLAASAASPAGTWEITSGESRYEVEMCGDGTALCATLVWIREDAKTPENVVYLNKQVVEVEKTQPAKWEGQVTFEGKTYKGNITMPDQNTLRIAGCKAVACKSISSAGFSTCGTVPITNALRERGRGTPRPLLIMLRPRPLPSSPRRTVLRS